MSDELDNIPDSGFSSFVPVLILAIGLLIWFGIQDYEMNSQRSALQKQLDSAQPTITEAHNIRDHYVALMKDVLQAAQKDDAAKAIVNDAIKAGLIHVQQGAPGAAPAPADPSAAPAK